MNTADALSLSLSLPLSRRKNPTRWASCKQARRLLRLHFGSHKACHRFQVGHPKRNPTLRGGGGGRRRGVLAENGDPKMAMFHLVSLRDHAQKDAKPQQRHTLLFPTRQPPKRTNLPVWAPWTRTAGPSKAFLESTTSALKFESDERINPAELLEKRPSRDTVA